MSELADYILEVLRERDEVIAENAELDRQQEEKIGNFAAVLALKALGVEVSFGDELTPESITQAINDGVLGGEFTFRNLFDKDTVKADCKRMALEQAASQFGFDGSAGVDGLKQAVIAKVIEDVRAEIEGGGGEYMAAALDLSSALSAINGRPEPGYNAPRDFSAKGVNNRARQAKFRESHTKVWVPR
jgi:hypothetical protein